jgi:CRP/FNR family transcriptional regulator
MSAIATLVPLKWQPAEQQGQAPGVTARGEIRCSTCNLRETCLPTGLTPEQMARAEKVVYLRRRVKRGDALFNAGDSFNAIYAIRSGFFKSSVVDAEGREQVTGFQMGGELLGLDAIGTAQHTGAATALEDSEVCVMPFSRVEELGR